MTAKIRVRDAERSFGAGDTRVHAMGPLSLDIEEGEFVCVVGPSGCGKSTLLRIIAGLVNPSAGDVVITRGASSTARNRTQKRELAVVFQDYSVLPWKTVRSNVRLGLDLAGVPRREANDRVDALLYRLGLHEFGNAYPHTLSGGMLQRVSIARALAVEPDILLMDEPFAALDAQMRAVLQDDLLALWQAERRTVLFITHSIEEAVLLGDRVVVMSSRPGRIIESLQVPFPRPRSGELRADPVFATFQQRIWADLRPEIRTADRPPVDRSAESGLIRRLGAAAMPRGRRQ
jgi:NitT/TauT family transport system ATP-binding protein